MWEVLVIDMATNLPTGGVSNGQGGINGTADSITQGKVNNAGTSAGSAVETPGKVGENTYTLSLNKSVLYLTPGQAYKLEATWQGKTPAHSEITWSSDKPSIAKVDSSGTVTAMAGIQTSKSKDGKTTGILSTDITKTYKATITATGGKGKSGYLGQAQCVVHVMPNAHYDAIKNYADKNGLRMSSEKMQQALQYAYENKAFRSDDSAIAKEGFIKAYLKNWYKNLPDRPEGVEIPEDAGNLEKYLWEKGKTMTDSDAEQLAKIMNIKYNTLDTKTQNKLLKNYQAYGFSKGGIVRGGIPASILSMIGADALIPRGDSTLIGANPGETVLTEEFTKQLKPTVQILNEFNRRMAQPIIEPSAAVQNQTTEVVNEYHFTFNNPVIKSQEDVQKMIEKAMDDRTKRNKRDWKKVR